MKSSKVWVGALAAVVGLMLGAGTALADDWQKVGELSKGGSVSVGKTISAIKVTSIDDRATINTVIVFKDGGNQSYPVRWSINSGSSQELSVGDQINVSKISMSLEVRHGRVEIYVK